MNKNRFLKALMLGFVMAIAVSFMAKGVTAQVINQQIMMQSPLCVPIPGLYIGTADYADLSEIDAILVDNFEYWNNPRNMGWTPIEPAYPIWGAGLGYGQLVNVLDFEEGSKVLDVFRPTSAFLLDPRTGMATYTITKSTRWIDEEDGEEARPIWGDFCEFSCKVRHPLSIEAWDTFSIIISVEVLNTMGTASLTDDINRIPVNIVLRPIEFSNRHETLADSVEGARDKDGDLVDEMDENKDDDQSYTIEVALGRQFQDGSWHYVVVNLEEIIKAADENCTLIDNDNIILGTSDIAPGTNTSIKAVTVMGNQYRLDDVMFTQPCKSLAENNVPHLFRIGPIYGQVWNVMQTFWVMAEDLDLGMGMFVNEDGDYQFANIVEDPTPDAPCSGDEKDVTFDLSCESGSLASMNDLTSQSDMETIRIQKRPEDAIDDCDTWKYPCGCGDILEDDVNLNFQFNVGDTLGSCAFLMARPIGVIPDGDDTVDVEDWDDGLFPFSQDQVDMFPPYLLQEDGVIIPNIPDVDDDDAAYLRSMTNPMYVMAVALYNAGHSVFPNVRALNPSFGQVPEDIIVTCRVTDGLATDKETFPVSVVNFPVTNFPPMLNDLYDQVFYVNETPNVDEGRNVYQVVATDHDLQDMFSLTYNCTLNGLPNYQVGPFQQRIIHPTSGLIAFTPYSEGALQAIIIVEDPRGMYAVGEITIFCCNRGTWFNHPPIITDDLESPVTIRAGQSFVANEMEFVDPDGDELYWSCNIGAVGADGLYTFQSQYPGYYLVQITAYDIRGGAATTEFIIHVLPWWAY